jgi:hypothetical protein
MRQTKATYIFLGVYVVGLSLFIYSKLNIPSKDSVYRIILSFIYFAAITVYLICNLLSRKIVVFDNCIQCNGTKIPYDDITGIEVRQDEILIVTKSTEIGIRLCLAQFETEVWSRLAEKMKGIDFSRHSRDSLLQK